MLMVENLWLHGKAIVGTVSGTSISFGSATTFESAATWYQGTIYDSTNQKVVIAYRMVEIMIMEQQL